ncbi:hypothetical protein BDZ89DRAFT_1130509 [Hymenopellis radicata]|nr:hypothetical protein BDZ89DRAFT_1130509 [Hymenopellis radicata]
MDNTRIRDNQRRSRQRKKEYVASLEARIAEYEKNGVQANVTLQQKARSVLEENKVLRKLLERAGVPDSEIHAALSNPTSLGESSACAPRSGCCKPSSSASEDSPSAVEAPPTASSPSPSGSNLSFDSLPDIIFSQSDLDSFLYSTLTPVVSPTSPTLHASLLDPDILLCQAVHFPAPTLEEARTRSFTPCQIAFDLLKTMNNKRIHQLNLVEFVFAWLWAGFRASSEGSCCQVDNEVLSEAAQTLLASS